MKKIKIKNKVFNIPETWSDITLNKFLRIKTLQKTISDNTTHEELLDFNINILNVITGHDKDSLMDLTPDEFKMVYSDIFKIINNEIIKTNKKIFEFKDKVLYFDTTEKYITYGQYMDLQNFLALNEDFWQNAHKITAVFVREVEMTTSDKIKYKYNKFFKKSFKIENYNLKKYNYNESSENSELFFEYMTMDFVYSVLDFFLILRKKYEHITQESSQNQELEVIQNQVTT